MTYVTFKPSVKRSATLADQLFNRTFSELFGNDQFQAAPAVNIVETANGFELLVAAPGLSKEDFDLSLEKKVLTISAQKEQVELPEGTTLRRKEFDYSQFKRSFTLSDDIETQEITAGYNNGVLSVFLPKKAEVANALKKISIA